MSSQSGQPSQQPAITDEDVLSRTLKVCGLQYRMDKSFLCNIFYFNGMLTSVKVIKYDDTGPLEGGDGFMEFKTHDFAKRVFKMYNGTYMPDGVNKIILEWPTFIPEDNLGKYVISVGNLSKDVNDFVLEKTFRCFYDSVKEAKVEIDEITGVSKGYGFVKFNDKFEQMRALNEMEGLLCSERPMQIGPITEENSKVSQNEKKSKMVGTILGRQLHIDHNIYIVNLYGTNIIVTVTSAATSSVIENWIETAFRLRRDVYRKSTFIIGFAIDPQVNTLQFSLGDSCLIFQLARADTIPQSLRDFMKDRMIGFPGFNNKTYFQDLRSSKHALEMYISPADLTRWDRRYRYDTVDELVKNCLGFRVKLEDEVMMSDWSVENLSDEQVVYACVKTHCAFHIGRQFHVWEWWC